MTSEKKYEANRANAIASTGPRSAHGKAISRLNAMTHGAFANRRMLPGEDAREYDELSTRVLAETKPKTAIENVLVDQLIGDIWRVMRVERAETAHIEFLQRMAYAHTLETLSDEEFAVAEKIVEDNEQLLIARQERGASKQSRAHLENAFARQLETFTGQPSGNTSARLTSAQRELISNIVKRKLDKTRNLENLLLTAMASEEEGAPYTALESMRRALVRDIVRQYANLLEIQERRQTIEPSQPE